MKKFMTLMLAAAMMAALVLTGCGSTSSNEQTSAETETAETTAVETETAETEAVETAVGMANPWEYSEDPSMNGVGDKFNIPEGAQNVTYGYCAELDLSEVQYTDESGAEIVVRTQPTGAAEDISGCSYEWSVTEDCTVSYCEGKLMQAEAEGETIDLCTWFDAVPGMSYSLTVTGADLDGFDPVAVAESVFKTVQGDSYSDDYISLCGCYTCSYDESTMVIGEDGMVTISLTRLAELEGTSSDPENGVLTFNVTDPNGEPMELTFDSASGVLTVTDSAWDLLANGDSFTFERDA